jgi:PPOX class probable F420-dependent enzyme
MTSEEVDDYLERQRVVICATVGPRGWPHLMPLWYVVRRGELWAWTYAKSQKVRNLDRDPRTTLEVEDGDQYHELRGVMIEARTIMHRDTEQVAEFGAELFRRYASDGVDPELIRAQAAKRVAMQFVTERIVSWDHRKLAGAY